MRKSVNYFEAHSLMHHLYVFFDMLFIESAVEGHNPTLQLVAKGDQGWSSIVFFCHAMKNWFIQENRGVLVHPGMISRKAKFLNLKHVKKCQMYRKECGVSQVSSWTGNTDIIFHSLQKTNYLCFKITWV